MGEVTSYTYNANRQLTGTAYPTGLVVTNIYDNDGWLTSTYGYAVANGVVTEYYGTNSFTYTNGLVRTHTDARGLTVTKTWDNLQRLTRLDFPDGTHTDYTYDKLDLVQVVDRMGYTNSFAYDRVRQKTFETNALGVVTAFVYCDCGGLEYVTNAVGTTAQLDTYYVYDNQGNKTHIFYPGYSVTNKYDSWRRLTNVTDTAGVNTTYIYSMQGTLMLVSNQLGLVVQNGYDINDRATLITDANGVTVSQTWDNLDRLLTRSYPTGGGSEKWGYTANVSGVTSYTNQMDTNVVRYTYDARGLKTNEVHGSTTAYIFTNSYAYTPAGDLKTLTDGNGHTTTWIFDQYGRVYQKKDNGNQTMFTYGYYPTGWLSNRVDGLGHSTGYAYDRVGNLTNVAYPSSPGISSQYDVLNRLTNMVDGVGTTSYSYGSDGLLSSEDGPWSSDTVSYTYSNRLRSGLTVQVPNASAWSQSYGYDNIHRLTSVTSQAGTFGYTYYTGTGGTSASRQISQLNFPGSASINKSYDNSARLTGTTLKNSAGQLLNQHAYTNNAAGQRTRQGRVGANFSNYVDYTYDSVGRLKSAIGKETSWWNRYHEQFSYNYDSAGNLTSRSQNNLTTSFTPNSLNELNSASRSGSLTVAGTASSLATSVTVNGSAATLYGDKSFSLSNVSLNDGNNSYTAVAQDGYGRHATNSVSVYLPTSVSFQYDGNGNLTSDGLRSFYYDDENQLTNVTVANSWKAEFAYDGLGRKRILREYSLQSGTALTNEVRYVYDGRLVIQERNNSNQPTVTYTRGLDLSSTLQGAGGIGGLLARSDSSASTHVYYHADGNGNVTALINSSQYIVARYIYDPYGNMVSQGGAMADANVYRFSSKEYHANSGLYYYGFRFYDPNLQQWLNRDSLGESGGINLYGFVGNSPINSIDAYGLAIAISDLWNGDAWHQLSEDTGVSHAVRCVRNTVHHIFIGNPKANADIMRYSNLALRVQEGITISPGGEAMLELGTGMLGAAVTIALLTPMFIEEGVFSIGGEVAAGQKFTGAQYEVGLAKDLRKTSQLYTEANHVPQTAQAVSLIGDYNVANKTGNEVAIRLSISEHAAVSAAQSVRATPISARQLLAQDILILRANTEAPNSALQKLIRMNKELHRADFTKY